MPRVRTHDPLLGAVVAATTEAGALAMARWQGQFRRWDKSPGNPVCEIDLAVDDLLRERLTEIDPGAGWLSEETADDPRRLDHERLWVVDPIDGTRDYVRGRPGWAPGVRGHRRLCMNAGAVRRTTAPDTTGTGAMTNTSQGSPS